MATRSSGMNTGGLHVFLSYRRSDCQAQANGLHDGLSHRLPAANIFMDMDSIPYGVDFEEHIRSAIEQCDIVLVLIGDNWLDVSEATGRRRIDEAEDFVRLEVENALKLRSVRVIPVLVEGAVMPRAAELPESIRRLARLNAIELSDRRWKSDVERLARLLEDLGSQPPPRQEQTPASIRLADIDGSSVKTALGALPAEFQTKDVSEHAAVVAAHGDASQARNYHAMIGTFIARNCESLGVRSLGKSSNGRGERWGRIRQLENVSQVPPASAFSAVPLAATQPAPFPHRTQPQAPYAPPSTPSEQRSGRASPGQHIVRILMILLPVFSFGFAAWVPSAWAATKAQTKRRRHALFAATALLITAMVVATPLMGSAPVDEGSTNAAGPADDLGVGLILLAMVGGTWLAVVNRNAGITASPREAHLGEVPGAAPVLQQRQTRARYHELVRSDPSLARDMKVGRPDLTRDFDDGGLVDFNHVPDWVLVNHAGLTPEEARRTVETRERLGRLSGLEDLVVFADVNPEKLERLRERALFL